MERRRFLKTLISSVSSVVITGFAGRSKTGHSNGSREIHLQTLSVAGFQFYHGEDLWNQLRRGDVLELISDLDNPYDPQAVKVMRGRYQLGHLPRRENATIQSMLTRDQKLIARISQLTENRDPWQRITIDISLQA